MNNVQSEAQEYEYIRGEECKPTLGVIKNKLEALF